MNLMKIIGPLLAPMLLEVWNQVVMPELQKAESGIAQADLKVVADKFIQALDQIAKIELPKVGAVDAPAPVAVASVEVAAPVAAEVSAPAVDPVS